MGCDMVDYRSYSNPCIIFTTYRLITINWCVRTWCGYVILWRRYYIFILRRFFHCNSDGKVESSQTNRLSHYCFYWYEYTTNFTWIYGSDSLSFHVGVKHCRSNDDGANGPSYYCTSSCRFKRNARGERVT